PLAETRQHPADALPVTPLVLLDLADPATVGTVGKRAPVPAIGERGGALARVGVPQDRDERLARGGGISSATHSSEGPSSRIRPAPGALAGSMHPRTASADAGPPAQARRRLRDRRGPPRGSAPARAIPAGSS